MLKAFTPVVTICVGRLAGMPPPSLPLSVAVCLIAGGVAVASWGEGALSVPGLAAMGASMVCEGARVLATQQLLGQRAMHPLRTLSYLAPAAGGWMLVICGAREVRA
jgi:drug/metabolite transporter (DMT)-like permease